jgi:CRISPR/Cas system-associated exonuclease Cas4 (RecB family)
MATIESPVMSISNGGLSIISPEIAEKLAKKSISPSLVTGLKGCAAQWAAGTFVMRDLIKEDPDNAATRGSLFHKVMEDAFADEPERRTRERINEHRDAVLETPEFSFFKEIPEALAWLDNAIDGYYAMGGRPELVKVASIKRPEDSKPKLGLEVFVKGNLAGAKRDTLGFIDRLTVDQKREDEFGVIIEDWKSGAKAKKWNPKTKSDDGRAEARQQVIYSMLLEQQGVNVTGARLIFPVAQEVVTVDLEDEKFKESVLEDIKEADEALDHYEKTNLFEFKPSFLCSWCPLAKICPKAQVERFAKARDAYAKQPAIEVLAQGFEFN